MSFIIRVETSQGTHRLILDSNNATFNDLQTAIQNKYGVPPEAQVISRQRLNNPDFIDNILSNTKLTDIGLQHGTKIYLVLVENQINDYKQQNEKNNKKPQQQVVVEDDSKNDHKDDIVDAAPKHTSFHEYIKESNPPQYNYKPVHLGNKVNFGDLPPNAVLVRQTYRHVDIATFYDSTSYQKFKAEWEKNSNIQKCAYLIGKYELIENKMCAKIYALYEPPQKGDRRGVELLHDNNEDVIDSMLKACDMERIGIIFTTLSRGGKKYNGDIFMSSQEMFTSAQLQGKYKNKDNGFSKFVTLICHVGMKEAQCFMISDQGVALIKNKLISAGTISLTDENKDNYGFMKVNIAQRKVYHIGIINENKEIKQGEHFQPDALLVNIIASLAKKQQHMFNCLHFPSPQNAIIDDVRKHLMYHKDKELDISLSDFNLLIYLTKVMDPTLVIKIAQHVVEKQKMNENLVKKIKSQLRIAVPGY